MKPSLAFTILLQSIVLLNGYAQNLDGRFEGAVTRDGSVQLVNFEFYMKDGRQKGNYEIPEIGSFDVPVDTIFMRNDTLNVKFYFGNFFCFADSNKRQITGISEGWLPKIRLHIKQSSSRKKPYLKEDIEFTNNEISLSGMLYHPENQTDGAVKYIVLVHGSGGQSRFAPYYISLGYSLSEMGYGVLLYDKRGTGSSSGNYQKASMDDLADDALAAVSYLKSRSDLNIEEIGLLGTSQGGWIAPMAANKSEHVDFIILNVAPAVSVFDQDIHRVYYSMDDDGWEQSAVDSAIAYTKLYFKYAENNKAKDMKALLKMSEDIKNREWAEYVNLLEGGEDFTWWRLNNYDPESALKKLNCRTLVLLGEKDVLVPPVENEEKMRAYLTEAGIDFEIVVIKGVAHDMLTYQGLNGGNWDWPQVSWQWRYRPAEFLNRIEGFLKK